MVNKTLKHHGRNIKAIRQLRGMKQNTFAKELGVSQQNISKMEKKKNLTDKQLEEAAKILHTTVQAIKDFDENAIIQNNFLNEQAGYINQKINPLEKIIELYDTIIKGKEQKIIELEAELESYRQPNKRQVKNTKQTITKSLRSVDGGQQAVK